MSTSVEQVTPAAGSRFVEFDEFIDYQLGKTGQGIRSADLMTGVVGGVLGISSYLLAFILLDHWVIPGGFSLWARLGLWFLGVAALIIWIILRIVRPFRRRINALYSAREIERTQPDLKSSLLTLIDVKQAGRATPGQIRSALEKRAAVNLSKTDVDQAVDRRTLMHCSYGLLGVMAVFVAYAVFSPKSIAQSAWRALAPFSGATAVTRTRIDKVAPGDITVPAYSQVELEVELSGQVPPEVLALFSTQDQKFVDEPLALRDTGEGLRRYRGTLLGEDGRGLRQTISYRIVAGDAESAEYQVRVVQPPTATVNEVTYRYPVYTQLAEKTEAGGAIDAWEGTRIAIHATANMPVKNGSVLFSDSEDTSVKAEELPLTITDGTRLSAEWQLAFRSDGSFPKFYRLQVRNEAGHTDPQPILHPVRIRADLPPKIEIITPKGDVTAPANGSVGVAFRASDPDFQLRSVVMRFEREGQELPNAPELFMAPPEQSAVDGVYTIRLQDLNLAAGSRLTWWLEARDNLDPFGARSGNQTVTPKLNIDIVAPQAQEDAQQQAAQAQQQAQQALDQSKREAQQASEDTGEEKTSDETQGEERGEENPEQSSPNAAEVTQETPADPNRDRQGQSAAPGAEHRPAGDEQQSGGNDGTGTQRRPDDQTQGQQGENTTGGTQQGSDTRPGPESSPQGTSHQTRPGKQGTEQKGHESAQSPGDRGTGEKPEEEQALEEIIKWDQQRRQAERNSARSNPGESTGANEHESSETPTQETQPDAGEREPQGADQRQPGVGRTPQRGQRPKSPDGRRTREESDDPSNGSDSSAQEQTGSQDASSNPSKAANPQRPQDSANRTAPPEKTGDRSEKPAESGSDTTGTDAPQEPGAVSTPPKPGDNAPNPGAPKQPGEKGTESVAQQRTDSGQTSPEAANPENRSDATTGSQARDGEPKTAPGEKTTRPSTGESQTPKDHQATSPSKDETAKPGESPSGESSSAKPGETNQSSQGEGTKGGSNERRNTSNKSTRTNENRGKASEETIGQPNEGERSGGEGNTGSSTAGKTGDQKTPGPGEAGQSGSQSASQGSNNREGAQGQKSTQGGASSKPSESGQQGGETPTGKPSGEETGNNSDSATGQESETGGDQKNPSAGGTESENEGQEGTPQQSGGESAGSRKPSDKPAGKAGSQEGSSGQEGTSGEQSSDGGAQQSQSQSAGEGQGSEATGEGSGGNGGKSGEEGGGSAGSNAAGSKAGGSQGSGSGGSGATGIGNPGGPGQGGDGRGNSGASQGESGTIQADAADLENRKKAANLALKRLQDTLERGNLDPELQKQLGFTDEQLAEFMERLEQRLADTGDDESPEAQARRRQFESLLRSINLDPKSEQRAGNLSGEAAQGFAAPRRPAPPEYREADANYKKFLRDKKGKP